MNIKFRTDQYPGLEIDLSVKPKVLGLNIELSMEGGVIVPIDAKKHKYTLSNNGNSYAVQITNTPYDSKMIVNGEKFDLTTKVAWYNYVIGGLPFTPATVSGAGTDQYTAVSVTFGSNWNASNNPTSARVHETSAYINLFRDGTTTIAVADAQTGGNDNYINIAGTYTTT